MSTTILRSTSSSSILGSRYRKIARLSCSSEQWSKGRELGELAPLSQTHIPWIARVIVGFVAISSTFFMPEAMASAAMRCSRRSSVV